MDKMYSGLNNKATVVEKVPEDEKVEKTKEEFDLEIEQEADKLGMNLQKLKAEIDERGGVEKFKEFFSTGASDFSFRNKAKQMLNDLSYKSNQAKGDAKMYAIPAIAATAFAVLLEFLGRNEHGILSEDPQVIQIAISAFFSAVGAGTAIASISERFKARRLSRQKQKEELKFKMTGTEVK